MLLSVLIACDGLDQPNSLKSGSFARYCQFEYNLSACADGLIPTVIGWKLLIGWPHFKPLCGNILDSYFKNARSDRLEDGCAIFLHPCGGSEACLYLVRCVGYSILSSLIGGKSGCANHLKQQTLDFKLEGWALTIRCVFSILWTSNS